MMRTKGACILPFSLPKGSRAHDIGRLAHEAMLVEVSVTPKPGLVDRNHNGAHRDMNFLTFMKSAAALRLSFDEFAFAGMSAGQAGLQPAGLFPELRLIGQRAESAMFLATEGINTHKGEIFTLGLLSACAGYLLGAGEVITGDAVMLLAGEVCEGLCKNDFAGVKAKPPRFRTKGEKAYLQYGATGVRGEAEAGYPLVRNCGLYWLNSYLEQKIPLNEAMAIVLVHLISENQDTNILARHNMMTLKRAMSAAKRVVSFTNSRLDYVMADIKDLDKYFLSKNISPSGSADLLAATYFLYSLTHSTPSR